MASRANKEERDDVPSYGAPISGTPPVPDDERERRRREKLEKKPSPEERQRLIDEHVEGGKAESAKRRDRRTGAPKPAPGAGVTDTEGKSTTELLEDRERDVEDTLHEMETGEPRPERKTDAERRKEEREREEASKPTRQPPKRG